MKKQLYLSKILLSIALIGAVQTSFVSRSYASAITEENLTNLINQQRSMRNLPKLKVNEDLDSAARMKSKDMMNRNYFEHFAFGMTPWDFIKNAGYDYLYAGENLAMDFNTSEGMVNAWMKSPAHRDNILSEDYTDMGIGIVKGEFTSRGKSHETTVVTNMFGREKPRIMKLFDFVLKNTFDKLF